MPLTIKDSVHQEIRCTAENLHASIRPVPVVKRGQLLQRAHFERLQKRIAPLRHALVHHPVYDAVDSIDRLRDFMQLHVFAVWDFMSLVKRLQSEVTGQRLPWMPPTSAQIARFANEVVLGEESDLGPDKKPTSHFQLYLHAMDEIGADTRVVRSFMQRLARGEHWPIVLRELEVPHGITDFVEGTLNCAIHGSVVEVAAYFLFGREDIIPEMFERLLKLWDHGAVEVPYFTYYLKRHIELDGDSHGPWAREMLITLAGQDDSRWKQATSAAEQAIISRIKLWDSVRAHFSKAPTIQRRIG
jgi:hypothetical protein